MDHGVFLFNFRYFYHFNTLLFTHQKLSLMILCISCGLAAMDGMVWYGMDGSALVRANGCPATSKLPYGPFILHIKIKRKNFRSLYYKIKLYYLHVLGWCYMRR